MAVYAYMVNNEVKKSIIYKTSKFHIGRGNRAWAITIRFRRKQKYKVTLLFYVDGICQVLDTDLKHTKWISP